MSDIQNFAEKSGRPAFVVAIAGSVLSIALLVLLLLPSLTSVAAVEVVEDSQTFLIGAVAEIEPARGWSAQPASREGVLLQSPDRVLSVTLRPAVPDEEIEGHLLVETLANGADLTHVAVEGATTAMLRLPDGGAGILVTAQVGDEADPDLYRAQLAELLLHVKPLD